jgi:mannose-6-phosphate isomerase-like protein (cupin superfamily)
MEDQKQGYAADIEQVTLDNDTFRTVLYTGQYMQLVVMSIEPGSEIGEEVHGQDQFLRIESGEGKAIIGGRERALTDGAAIIVPAGTTHNIINTGSGPLKLYSIYAAPHHKDGTVHLTKEDAEADHEEYLGDTTE